jgi:alpha-tubulin suppressor-like RCC1 family protein
VTLTSNNAVKGEKYFSHFDATADSSADMQCPVPFFAGGSPKNALRASRISCGGLHTAAIDLHGNVYCWGKADSGQTGYADWYQAFSAAVCSPRRVEGLGPRLRGQSAMSPYGSPQLSARKGPTSSGGPLSDVKDGTGLRAVEVSCGGFHTMVLMEDGSVYAMGKQDFGMLGTGTELSVSIDIGVEAPTLVQYSPATSGKAYKKPVRATHVTTGGWHTAIINARGALYMCGKGEYGRLGLGDEKSRMGLTLVCAPQYVAVPSSVNAPLLPPRG